MKRKTRTENIPAKDLNEWGFPLSTVWVFVGYDEKKETAMWCKV